MTGEEILAIAKVVFVDNTLRLPPEKEQFKEGIDGFLRMNEYLKVGSNKAEDFYTDPLNCHHYTTEYWYSVMNTVLGYMGITFKRNQFELYRRVFNIGDFSFLVPKSSPWFRIVRTPVERVEDKLYYWQEKQIDVVRFEGMSFIPEDGNCKMSPYHSLFSGMHEPCTVENLGKKEGKTIIISGNSHTIPLIPILACYCKKVICLDVRLPIDYSFIYKDLKPEDVEAYLFVSYDDDIEKFTKLNLK